MKQLESPANANLRTSRRSKTLSGPAFINHSGAMQRKKTMSHPPKVSEESDDKSFERSHTQGSQHGCDQELRMQDSEEPPAEKLGQSPSPPRKPEAGKALSSIADEEQSNETSTASLSLSLASSTTRHLDPFVAQQLGGAALMG